MDFILFIVSNFFFFCIKDIKISHECTNRYMDNAYFMVVFIDLQKYKKEVFYKLL